MNSCLFTCPCCNGLTSYSKYIKHHVSYFPEKIIDICLSCHSVKKLKPKGLIQYTNEEYVFFYEHLEKFRKLFEFRNLEEIKQEKETRKEQNKTERRLTKELEQTRLEKLKNHKGWDKPYLSQYASKYSNYHNPTYKGYF